MGTFSYSIFFLKESTENLQLVDNYYITLKNQNNDSLLEYWFQDSRDNYEFFKSFVHKTKISFNNPLNK